MTSLTKSAATPAVTTSQFTDGNEIDETDFTTLAGEIDDLADTAASNVSVSANDTHVKNLEDAISAGVNISITVLNEGGNEQLQINNTGSTSNNAAAQPIINGYMLINQTRQSSVTSLSNLAYIIDQWQYRKLVTSAVHDGSQDSSVVPTEAEAGLVTPYSLKLDCTTADASVAAGDLVTVFQPIEGFNWLPIAEQQFTVTFWVRSPKTGVHYVAACNDARNVFYCSSYTIASADTWEQHTVTIGAFDATADAGTWNYDYNVGMELHWVLMGGSSNQGTVDQWNSGTTYCGSDQVNCCDNTANNFYLTNVTINSTTPYRRTYQDELTHCQRYAFPIHQIKLLDDTYNPTRIHGYSTTTGTIHASIPQFGNFIGFYGATILYSAITQVKYSSDGGSTTAGTCTSISITEGSLSASFSGSPLTSGQPYTIVLNDSSDSYFVIENRL